MTDDSAQDNVPDSDPTHIDPAGALADLIAADLSGVALSEEQDPAELREFITSVEDSDEQPTTYLICLSDSCVRRLSVQSKFSTMME